MNEFRVNLLKRTIIIIISIIVLLSLFLGIQRSDFSKLKKYDNGKSLGAFFGSKGDTVEVSIVNKNEINLGDFVFNVEEDKKLLANISIIYKPKNGTSFMGNSGDEFIKKGVLLRDATINAMIESRNIETNINNDRIKDKIKNKLNNILDNSAVEEVYFNKFIIQ